VPSPNGYLTAIDISRIDRSWARGTVHYDLSQPPWPNPADVGGWQLEYLVGNSPTGPWRPAPLTSPATQCNTRPTNFSGLEQSDGTTIGVGGVGGVQPPQPDTDYWVRVLLHDDTDTVVDDWVQGPFHTAARPTFLCNPPQGITETSADLALSMASGRLNLAAPCNQDGITWELSTTPTGPWTAAPREVANDFTPTHTFSGLTPGTTYYYRARFDESITGAPVEYLATTPCTFTTEEATVTTPPFNPQPCATGAGGGPDIENQVLCDLDAEGNLLGTALAVYEYDAAGELVLPPTYVDPVTGQPYVAQGTLQVCPDAACLPPMQFCQTGTSTAPVEHPGRQYDITLPVNPGFGVETLNVDAVSNPVGITWQVDDPDGEGFRTELTTFLEGRLPAAAVVTITNPNAGVQQVCGAAQPMQVHIECLRLDQNPPNLIELVYNGGQDLIQNPAYNEFPPLNPPVSQGNYGFRLLSRQDDPGPFPGNPPQNDALCTSVVNRGWETNDRGRTFEIWGRDIVTGSNVTPTPRGTPVQEMTSDGPPTTGGRPSTIWQTFTVPASGNFVIRVVHGSRDPGEQHRITLDNGDTDDAQNGDLIDDITTPASVTSNGGPNPWTQFNQTIPLNGGSTYTLALSTTNPVGGARGGLFTDMRAFIDRPGLRATATTDDETCVVTVDETSTTTTCLFWQPQCSGGNVVGWQRLDTGDSLTNTEFWAQTPTPKCCTAEAAEAGGGGQVSANLAVSDVVCATVGGIQQNAVRQVVLDPSGGQLSQLFLTTDGQSITPDTWTPGGCTTQRVIADVVLCDTDPGTGATVNFLRKYVQTWSPTAGTQITETRDFNLAGTSRYTPVGLVADCTQAVPGAERELLCDTDPTTGVTFTFLRTYITRNGAHTGLLDTLPDGTTAYTPTGVVGNCDQAMDPIATTGLCLSDGTPIAVVTRRDSVTRDVTRDGWINLVTGVFTTGAPPVGTVACGSSRSIEVSGVFCDVTGSTVNALVLVEYQYAADGSISSVRLVDATTGATHTVIGTITTCPSGTNQPEQDAVVLCDVNGAVTTPFIRDYRRDSTGAITAASNYTLAGAAYSPTGTVGICTGRDSESVILCDSAAVPNRFIRTYTYDPSGAIAGFTDRTLAGAAFTPTGAVGLCTQPTATDFDVAEEILCDANGTSFIRRFTFNSSTGAVTSTVNLTLAGAAFTPVGAVGICSNCCPQVIGEGCSNTGSGRYTAVRATNGTVTLIDSVSGTAITAANIIACPTDDVVRTLSAQARLIGDADAAWTPGGDVTGTLTSVTMTVLSGTANLTDADGTTLTGLPAGLTLTWEAEDDNTLTGPQSIDAVGGNTVVNWTSR
jgi:hypothetical protein